jgi:hypothetical protein
MMVVQFLVSSSFAVGSVYMYDAGVRDETSEAVRMFVYSGKVLSICGGYSCSRVESVAGRENPRIYRRVRNVMGKKDTHKVTPSRSGSDAHGWVFRIVEQRKDAQVVSSESLTEGSTIHREKDRYKDIGKDPWERMAVVWWGWTPKSPRE